MSEHIKTVHFKQLSPSVYEAETDEGYITGEFNRISGEFKVGYVYIEPNQRRKKAGKRLAQEAVNLAHALGADTITASLTSREGYELSKSMFGEEHLTLIDPSLVQNAEGSSPTFATLSYPLADTTQTSSRTTSLTAR